MRFLSFVALICAIVLLIVLICRFTNLQWVKHTRLLFRTWSVWLASSGSVISAWTLSFPDSAVQAWTLLPPDLKTLIPAHLLAMIGPFMAAMGVLAQFVRQRELAETRRRIDNGQQS